MRLSTRDDAKRLPVVNLDQTRAVAGYPSQRLIPPAADALERLLSAAAADGLDLRPVSTWRARPWPNRAAYEQDMVKRYGSVAEGQKWVAWDSLHHRGIAVDFAGEGLSTSSRAAGAMKSSKGFLWLQANAGRFGFGSYDREPWHWEYRPASRLPVVAAVVVGGALVAALWWWS
jgi:LAS superfamily LD-carboxypeptidase LdcB